MEEECVLQSFQKSLSCSAVIVVNFCELHEASESEPSTFCVMNIHAVLRRLKSEKKI